MRWSSLQMMSSNFCPRTKPLNGTCFYDSAFGCNDAGSRAGNYRWPHASLPEKYEATRDIPMVCGRQYANDNLVHPAEKHSREPLRGFDTWLFPFYPFSAAKNRLPWPCRQRSGNPFRARKHQRRVGNRNPRREMKNSPMAFLSFLQIRFSFSPVEQFMYNLQKCAVSLSSRRRLSDGAGPIFLHPAWFHGNCVRRNDRRVRF